MGMGDVATTCSEEELAAAAEVSTLLDIVDEIIDVVNVDEGTADEDWNIVDEIAAVSDEGAFEIEYVKDERDELDDFAGGEDGGAFDCWVVRLFGIVEGLFDVLLCLAVVLVVLVFVVEVMCLGVARRQMQPCVTSTGVRLEIGVNERGLPRTRQYTRDQAKLRLLTCSPRIDRMPSDLCTPSGALPRI